MPTRTPAARLCAEPLEDRATPVTLSGGTADPTPPGLTPEPALSARGLAVTWPAQNGVNTVRVYRTATAFVEFQPYAKINSVFPTLHVATGDMTGDGVPEVVTAGAPLRVAVTDAAVRALPVKVFDGATLGQPSPTVLRILEPFGGSSYTGGIFVACGDVDADGKADLAVSRDLDGTGRVKIYSGAELVNPNNGIPTPIADFEAIVDPNVTHGCHVALGDLNADGVADVLAGAYEAPRVAGWDGTTLRRGGTPARVFNDFYAFDPDWYTAVHVAVADLDGDGFGEVVAGERPEPAYHQYPRAAVYDGQDLAATYGATRTLWFQRDLGDVNAEGIRLLARDLNGDGRGDLIVSHRDSDRVTILPGGSYFTALGGWAGSWSFVPAKGAAGVWVG
jgi:hypothetical protein